MLESLSDCALKHEVRVPELLRVGVVKNRLKNLINSHFVSAVLAKFRNKSLENIFQ